ncbi:HK97 family phage prohead protease [Jeotgalibacillus proteolyticus]|uniref:HK97 family phage prohead protease n=1 Tax=Jeotgalibacillus proteolyticus TaxID=2082395 RepID=A0A2S5GG63_9BACL|nr:HK97 family phage prohead protease [Jeotgalibacillus proteolyticus]PPA71914.1 HK97 family phage prohead protease [Jeotgalibacillus proteolyticus]
MNERQMRSFEVDLTTRAEPEHGEMIIEGYFALYNSETELWPGAYEEIAPGAFDGITANDVRALINHDTGKVLARTASNTLILRVDDRGLWGQIRINENDSEAVNLYQRVKRGDVDQCSFGFLVEEESSDYRDDGTVKWTLVKVDVVEVSVVTFPAYADTAVAARQKDMKEDQQRMLEARKNKVRERLGNGTKTVNAK